MGSKFENLQVRDHKRQLIKFDFVETFFALATCYRGWTTSRRHVKVECILFCSPIERVNGGKDLLR